MIMMIQLRRQRRCSCRGRPCLNTRWVRRISHQPTRPSRRKARGGHDPFRHSTLLLRRPMRTRSRSRHRARRTPCPSRRRIVTYRARSHIGEERHNDIPSRNRATCLFDWPCQALERRDTGGAALMGGEVLSIAAGYLCYVELVAVGREAYGAWC